VYHDFLILLEQQQAMMTGFAPRDRELFNAWLGRFYAQFQGLHLFGAQGVRDALGPVGDALGRAAQEALDADPNHELDVDRMATAYRKHQASITAATADLTMAMRDDVAVDPPPDIPALHPGG
jgi:hypothetical protein